MTNRSKRKKGKKLTAASGGSGQSYRDYNPATVNPTSEQFTPTEGSPIPRRAKQAGVS